VFDVGVDLCNRRVSILLQAGKNQRLSSRNLDCGHFIGSSQKESHRGHKALLQDFRAALVGL
jgi:hypothetical protein